MIRMSTTKSRKKIEGAETKWNWKGKEEVEKREEGEEEEEGVEKRRASPIIITATATVTK